MKILDFYTYSEKIDNIYLDTIEYLDKNTCLLSIFSNSYGLYKEIIPEDIIESSYIKTKYTKSWEGQKTGGRPYERINFNYNKKWRKFFKKYNKFIDIDNNSKTLFLGEYDEDIDIGFYDKNGECIMLIITHETLIGIREDLYEKLDIE